MRPLGWCGLALLLAISPVRADDLDLLAKEAMTLSGTQAELEGMGKLLENQSASDPRMTKLNKRERAQLLSTMKSAFDGQRMSVDLTAQLAGTHDRERLTAAVATMRGAQFQKLTQTLVAENLAATDQKVLAYTQTFKKTPPDPARVQLILRLDAATDSARILADIRYESVEALLGDKATAEDRTKLAAMREQIETAAKNESVVRLLHLTRKLDSATLESYVKTYENEPMGWLARQLGYGMQRAVVKAVSEVGRNLAALAPAPKP
jgi:restriction endonuclease Mrr